MVARESPIIPPVVLSILVYKYCMNDDRKIPTSWAVPNDLAKKVNETLNKKRITPEDELADALEEMARDIALIDPNHRDWGGWVSNILE